MSVCLLHQASKKDRPRNLASPRMTLLGHRALSGSDGRGRRLPLHLGRARRPVVRQQSSVLVRRPALSRPAIHGGQATHDRCPKPLVAINAWPSATWRSSSWLPARRRLRQRRQHSQALRQVRDRFHMRRALEGAGRRAASSRWRPHPDPPRYSAAPAARAGSRSSGKRSSNTWAMCWWYCCRVLLSSD